LAAALRSLTGVRRVVAGFDLSEFHFDNKEVSHGARLWGNFIGLMLTHAWLEQRNREIRELRDGTRAVVATAEDYAAVYEIFKATSRRSVVNLSDTHQSIVQAVYDLGQTSKFAEDGFSTRAVAEEAGVSKGTVSKNRTFLTKSAGLLYDTEDGRLAISKDAEPSWWTVGDVMAGFPRVADVYAADGKPDPDGPPSGGPSGSKGDTSPENSGNEGNTETVGKKPDTYAAEPVSEGGNDKETPETLFPNGSDPTGPKVVNINNGESYDVYIGWQVPPWRSPTGEYIRYSKWRNPFNKAFRDGWMTQEEACEKYLVHVLTSPKLTAALPEIRGKILGCHCAPEGGLTKDDPLHCHGQVLLRLATSDEDNLLDDEEEL